MQKDNGRVLHRTAIATSVIAWGIIFWTAYFVEVESYDGYEYLLTARTLLGESTVFAPKNASFTTLLAILSWVAKPLGWDTDLRYFHLALSVGAVAAMLALSVAIARVFPKKTSWAVIFALFSLNRTVMAFAPSALSDVTAAIVCAWWWYLDASWVSGKWELRPMIAAVSLVFLGRINAVFFPFFTQAFRWLRGQSRQAWRIGIICWSASFGIYVLLSALFNLAGNFDVVGKPWYFKFLRGIIGNHDYLRIYARMVRNHPRISYVGLAQALLATSVTLVSRCSSSGQFDLFDSVGRDRDATRLPYSAPPFFLRRPCSRATTTRCVYSRRLS